MVTLTRRGRAPSVSTRARPRPMRLLMNLSRRRQSALWRRIRPVALLDPRLGRHPEGSARGSLRTPPRRPSSRGGRPPQTRGRTRSHCPFRRRPEASVTERSAARTESGASHALLSPLLGPRRPPAGLDGWATAEPRSRSRGRPSCSGPPRPRRNSASRRLRDRHPARSCTRQRTRGRGRAPGKRSRRAVGSRGRAAQDPRRPQSAQTPGWGRARWIRSFRGRSAIAECASGPWPRGWPSFSSRVRFQPVHTRAGERAPKPSHCSAPRSSPRTVATSGRCRQS